MRALSDPCRHWAVFRMLGSDSDRASAQVSILKSAGRSRLYCCESVRRQDLAGNTHVLCAGIDLAPALETLGDSAQDAIDAIETACNRAGGQAMIPEPARKQLLSVSKILNIGWIADGIAAPARIICQRSSFCPREPHCLGAPVERDRPFLEDLKDKILSESRG